LYYNAGILSYNDICSEKCKNEDEGVVMDKIIANKIRCIKCGDIIESEHRHDFKFCQCGAVAVDGGKDYLRRVGNREDWEEMSE